MIKMIMAFSWQTYDLTTFVAKVRFMPLTANLPVKSPKSISTSLMENKVWRPPCLCPTKSACSVTSQP